MSLNPVLPAALILTCLLPRTIDAQTSAELDAYWAELVRTVEEGDLEGYRALYDPQAIVVDGTAGTTMPFEQSLPAVASDFLRTREGK